MITKTTRLSHSWFDRLPIPPAAVVALLVLFAAAGISAYRRLDWPAEQAQPLRPIIMIATAVQPQPTAPLPTPDEALRMEVQALRARVAELEQRPIDQPPAPEPQPIYVPQPVYVPQPEPVYTPPTALPLVPTEHVYTPPVPTPAPYVPNGGSGKMPAIDMPPIDSNAEWCAAAAASGQARCVEP